MYEPHSPPDEPAPDPASERPKVRADDGYVQDAEDGDPWLWAGEPPFRGTTINADGWWGCPDWLIHGEPPTDLAEFDWALLEMPEAGARLLAELESQMPGDLVNLGYCRLTGASSEEAGRPILIELDVVRDRAVAPKIISYVEAVAEVVTWRWLVSPTLANGDENRGEYLGGLKPGGDLVAVVAPAVVLGGWSGG